jgi:hypothetical protein
MTSINKLTAFLAVIFLSTVAASLTTLRSTNQDATNSVGRGSQQREAHERRKDRFPVAEYDAPEDADPDKRKERKGKGRRYDNSAFVRKQSSTDITETVFNTEWYQGAEALPVRQSQKIVVGVVIGSEAHLSNDKSGVYMEFVVEIEEVLKSNGGDLAGGTKISVDRPGGVVRYPGGHKRLYRFSNMNAPAVGQEYIFFLKQPEPAQNYGVITAYELGAQGVTPLDSLSIFQTFAGMDKAAFLRKVREAILASN